MSTESTFPSCGYVKAIALHLVPGILIAGIGGAGAVFSPEEVYFRSEVSARHVRVADGR